MLLLPAEGGKARRYLSLSSLRLSRILCEIVDSVCLKGEIMGTVYKETFTKPLPVGVKIRVRKEQRLAQGQDAPPPQRTRPKSSPFAAGCLGGDCGEIPRPLEAPMPLVRSLRLRLPGSSSSLACAAGHALVPLAHPTCPPGLGHAGPGRGTGPTAHASSVLPTGTTPRAVASHSRESRGLSPL